MDHGQLRLLYRGQGLCAATSTNAARTMVVAGPGSHVLIILELRILVALLASVRQVMFGIQLLEIAR